jgi:aspartate-semialdehyde dehydrogenase
MKVALIGPKGAVGRVLLKVLEEHWPKIKIRCFSKESGIFSFAEKNSLPIELIESFEPSEFDLIFSAASAEVALSLKEKIKKSGVPWVDKSSALRDDEDAALVIPEINGLNGKKIASSPNCVAIPLSIFLKSMEGFDIKFVSLSTYQSVSGAGAIAMDKFMREMKTSLSQPHVEPLLGDHPIAMNVIPEIGEVDHENFCEEERKIESEVRRILNVSFPICITCVRVPVLIGHGIAVNFCISEKIERERIEKAMHKFGIYYANASVTPLSAAREDLIYASRLKNHGGGFWSIWLICDNLRKGAALNSFQIARMLVNY